jgi:putative methionine-R-sulfoxide reductase with GAF domain
VVNFLDWQDYILVGFPLALAGVSLASIFIMKRGHLGLGSGIVFSMNLVLPLLLVIIVRNALWTALSYAAVSSALLIWRALPHRFWRWSIIAAVTVMIMVVAIENIGLPNRFQNPPALNAFVVVLISVLFVAFIVQAVRQTWGRSMRNKLLVAFIGITVVAAGTLAAYVFTTTNNSLRQGLERELTKHTGDVATRIGDLLNEQISTLKTLSLNEVLEQTAEDLNEAYTGGTATIQADLNAKDEQWRAADAANNNNNPLVREFLTNPAALELKEFQDAFPNNAEIFITDKYGGLAGTTNRTSDYYQADEGWWQAAYNNGQGAVYISEPEFDESAGALAVLIALPIRSDETHEIIGILRTTFLTSAIGNILDEPVGKTGQASLFIPGEVIFHFHEGKLEQVEPEEYARLQAVADQGMVEMGYEGDASVVLQAPIQTLEGNLAVDNLGWMIVFHQHQNEAFAPVNIQIRGAVILISVIMLIAVVAAIGLSIFLVRPISELTQTAEEVAAGKLGSRAKVTSSDEVGILASTFNSMTSQLQEILQSLEQRVAARTKDLEIVAEVGTATATILESKRLLQEVVDLTKERFYLYHSHIYLLDEEGKNLVLAAGAGEPGRQMLARGLSIPLDRKQSLVARAARERKGVTVNDVTQAPDFLPNPLLPDTRSELAVPMIVGGKVIGVFDIQSEQVGRFTDADVNIQTTLAAQLATSIQNVRSFEQSRKQAELESMVNTIGQKIRKTASVEDTLQTAIREIGLALGASRVSASIGTSRQPDGDEVRRN